MKAMILRIAELLNLRKPRPTPFGLTSDEISSLRELESHPGWRIFSDLLDQHAIFSAEKLLHETDEAQIHFLRGFILGLRRAGMTIQEVKVLQEKQHERARSQSAAVTESRSIRRGSAYGSPFWA